MVGIDPEDITDLVVLPPSRRLRSIDMESNSNTSAAILTSYVVRTSNTSLSYSSLSAQLVNAVNTGTFNTILSTNAQVSGATALEGCTSSPVTTVPIDTSSSSDSADSLSGGAIAGIVIGVVVGVALIAAVIYYYLVHNVEPVPTQTPRKQTTTEVELSQSPSVMYDNPIASKKKTKANRATDPGNMELEL
jgi:hypothetical protein